MAKRKSCCESQVPQAGGTRSDGSLWTRPTCNRTWVHETEESDGSAWGPYSGDAVEDNPDPHCDRTGFDGK